ncbi:MAG: amino acid--tRNA ligase-related protein [Spirochaetia bacterium]
MARLRARVIAETRRFFDLRSYLEVDTPLLAPALIPEPHIEVFATEYRVPHCVAGTPRFLIPSPEVWMKELLSAGYGNIYQLGHCFRNAESTGPRHSPEFTMLEWYNVDADYMQSADHIDDLLEHLTSMLTDHIPAERIRACRPPAFRLSVSESFRRYAGIGAGAFDSVEQMRGAASAAGLSVQHTGAEGESYDDLFQRMFLTLVEEKLPTDRPVILTDYPAALPTLAEQSPGTPFARRWELYLCGIEVANCYSEERDPDRLRSYLQHAREAKRRALVPHPAADGLVAFSSAPVCSGVALGVDRLLMALTGAKEITEVIFSTTFGIFR